MASSTILSEAVTNNPMCTMAAIASGILLIIIGIQLFWQFMNWLFKPRNQTGGAHTRAGRGGKRLVLYFAPWCGHCQKLKPIWSRIESEYNGYNMDGEPIQVEAVNGDQNSASIREMDIKGYPTIVLFKSNGERLFYQGDRSYEDIINFLRTR
jgi:thiol-disulfide isomerase/thioredoxin